MGLNVIKRAVKINTSSLLSRAITSFPVHTLPRTYSSQYGLMPLHSLTSTLSSDVLSRRYAFFPVRSFAEHALSPVLVRVQVSARLHLVLHNATSHAIRAMLKRCSGKFAVLFNHESEIQENSA